MIFMFAFLEKTCCTGQKIFYSLTSIILLLKKKRRHTALLIPAIQHRPYFLITIRMVTWICTLLITYLSAGNTNTIYPRDRSGRSPANDKLYRNDGDSSHAGHPVFSDVSMQAGIKEDGYGLGVAVSDFNNDGWPDIYVANDFVSNDELWLNNRNGTFTNCIDKSIRHQSYSSMGADAADINNDALPDIVTLDMLPEYNERKKTSFSFMNYERYEAERAMGYEPEFMRNMLQLNNGSRMHGRYQHSFF